MQEQWNADEDIRSLKVLSLLGIRDIAACAYHTKAPGWQIAEIYPKQERNVTKMPRLPKSRRICRLPQTLEFTPTQCGSESKPVILAVDEYEAIRLIDKEGLSQEQCSERMQVARTTVQKIYESARKKLADALVDGRPLQIEGGAYRLCGGDLKCCVSECHKVDTESILC